MKGLVFAGPFLLMQKGLHIVTTFPLQGLIEGYHRVELKGCDLHMTRLKSGTY
jgi:hypothetical protein